MSKRVLIDTWQQVSHEDYLKFGTFAEAAVDTIIGKVLIPDLAYEGFSVIQSGAAEVTVSSGHLFSNGKVYINDTDSGIVIDLLSRRPVATKRIITIAAWGTDSDSAVVPRTFLTDAITRSTVAEETPTEHWRWANVGPVSGIEAPDPQPPALASNVLAAAYITMTTTGIESIIVAYDNIVPTLREVDNRLNEFDIWKVAIGTRLDTLAADLLALAAKLVNVVKWDIVLRAAADLARAKRIASIPDVYVTWGDDIFNNESNSDTTHVDWLAKIDEGVRFSPAATSDAQLGLLNPDDTLVINTSSVLLPDWVSVPRLSQQGSDLQISIASYQYQTNHVEQKALGRYRFRYGTIYTVTSTSAGLNSGAMTDVEAAVYETYLRDSGEVVNEEGDLVGTYVKDGTRVNLTWEDIAGVSYWDLVIDDHTVEGAVLSQTFINSQDGWLNSVNLYFSKVGPTGPLYLLITETTNGAPDLKKAIAYGVLDQSDMHLSPAGANIPTTVNIDPTFLGKERYAVVLITGGNHYLWALRDTNYLGGSLFFSTDGGWFQGSLANDLALDLNFCHFSAPQTRVQLNPLQLTDGMTAIDLNARAFIPDGCDLLFEAQKSLLWYTLDGVSGGGPLSMFVGLPDILPFRAVFVGTEWVQPALGVGVHSRVQCTRPRSDMRHVSTPRVMPIAAPITKIACEVRIENWRGGPDHVFNVRLTTPTDGSDEVYLTVTDSSTMSEYPAPDDASAINRLYTWVGLPSTAEFRFRMDGTTNNVLTTYHVSERVDVENT